LWLGIWAVLYVFMYSALRIFWPHHWYYFPLYVLLCVLFSVGLIRVFDMAEQLKTPFRFVCRSMVLGLYFGALGLQLFSFLNYQKDKKRSFFQKVAMMYICNFLIG